MTEHVSIEARIGPHHDVEPLSDEQAAELRERLHRDQQTSERLREAIEARDKSS